MNKLKQFYCPREKTLLWNTALLIFIAIIIFHGTYIRVRPMEDIPEMDWVVFARLISCFLGFVVGFLLFLKSHARFGFGSICLLIFLAATGLSAINSPYPTTVIGYVVLLLGAGVLILGLVNAASTVENLEQIETIWFFTVALCVVKDVITSLVIPQPDVGGEALRLGMGITHANHLSLLAGLAFWLSFKQTKANMILWLIRILMLYFIIGTVSRVGILAFIGAGFIYFFLRTTDYFRRWFFVFTSLSVIVFFLLTFSFHSRWGDPFVNYLKRGQTQQELGTFTGRTLIWKQALQQFSESPLTGHGYCIARFTLKPFSWDYQPPHCHNEIIEALFCIGILGTIPLLLILLYNMKWVICFSRLKHIFSSDIALHAVCVVVMLSISMVFEARITARLYPFQPLFFFYLLMLDREKQFAVMKQSLLNSELDFPAIENRKEIIYALGTNDD